MKPPVPATATRRHAVLHLVWVVLVVLAAAGLLVAAVLVPAPAAVLPFLAVACVGLPMIAARDVDIALRALGGRRAAAPQEDPLDPRALAELRRTLDRLPETKHPLGL
jgi:hypothetical protein